MGLMAILPALSKGQTITSTSKGGLWNSAATWIGGVVPTAGQNVVIADSSIVYISSSVSGINNITVGQGNTGILQCGAALTLVGNLQINAGAKFLAHTNTLTGVTINIGGDFNNNGEANLSMPSTILNFNGSQQSGGSLNQNLAGTGLFIGDGTNGIIRSLYFQTRGNSAITTTQPIITSELRHTAGTLVTNNKLTIDNTAQVYGQSINRQIYGTATIGMGAGYSNAPVVFGAAINLWIPGGTAVANSRYFFDNNVYLCIIAGSFDATAPPLHTAGTVSNGSASLLWIGTIGTIGTPFQASVANTVGTQYVYGENLYTALNNAIPAAANPPTCLSGTCNSGTATFLYAGKAAKVAVNYDGVTQTVRSLTLLTAGSGYTTTAPAIVFNLNGGTVTTAASANAIFLQSVPGPANALFTKSPLAVIDGGLNIKSNQSVGGITTTNGGVNYSAAPQVGFSLPTGFLNLITNSGSGYTGNPTITVSGGTLLPGGTNPSFSVVVAQGKVVSVICTAGGSLWQSPPTITLTGGGGTGATAAFPANCLATANAALTNGSVTDFTIANPGYGYTTAPTVGLVASGTVIANATAPTCRLGLYNLTYNTLAPVPNNAPVTAGIEIPANNRINVLNVASSGGIQPATNIALANNLELYAASGALTFSSSSGGANVLNLNSRELLFSHPSNTGSSGSATTGTIANGTVRSILPGGAVTRNFPFDATFSITTGSGSGATGSSITSITLSRAGAPSGTVSPTGYVTGTRSYRVQTQAGEVFGTNPTVSMNFNVNDTLNSDNAGLLVAQATSISGPWAVRSISTGTGILSATGIRTTATTAPGPVVMTGDDYFGWASIYVPPPALKYNITRTTGINYRSIVFPDTSGSNILGFVGTSTDDNTSPSITIPSSTFLYQGETVTGFNMSTNGWIKLITASSPSTTNTRYQNQFGGGEIPMLVAAFWDDITTNPNSGGLATLNARTRYKIEGAVPGTRKIICEWYNYTVYSAPGPQLNFQVVLNEADNSISFNYGAFQGFNGTSNHKYSYSMGLAGKVVDVAPKLGQLLAQQYENSDVFSSSFCTSESEGANALMVIPACNSSIKFTPSDVYAGGTIPSALPPLNDERQNAIEVLAQPVFPENLCGNFFSSRFATPSSDSACAGNKDDDVWFKFVALEPITTVRVYGSGGYIPRLQVLDSSFQPLNPSVCVVGTGGGTRVDANFNDLITNAVYYVRVYHDGGGVQATGIATINAAGAVTGVTITDPGSGYGGVSTITGGTGTARVRFSGGGGTDAVGSAVLSGSTIGSITINNGGYGYTAPPAVIIESPAWAHTGEFALIVYAVASNDNCTSATELTGLSSVNCNVGSNAATASTVPATASAEAAVCGTPDDDVWYRFTADKTITSITVSGTINFNAAMEIFDGGAAPGNCTAKTSLQCINATGAGGTESILLNTIVGNTYFIRVYHAGTSSIPGERFTICVSSFVPPCLSAPVSPLAGDTLCRGGNLLKWNKEIAANGYRVYLDAGTNPATTLVATKTSNNDTTYNAGSLPPGNYSWQVEPTNAIGPASGCVNWSFTRKFVIRDTFAISGCNGLLYNGVVYTASTTRLDTLLASDGCDSLIRFVIITVNQIIPVVQSTNLTGCNAPVIYNGVTYNNSTTILDTIRSYQGCDSVYKIVNIAITYLNPGLVPASNLVPVNNAANLDKPINFSWSYVPNAAFYDLFIWPATGVMPTLPTVSGLTLITYSYNAAPLLYGTTYKWLVRARNGNCTSESAIQQFTMRNLPDLVVQNITVPATATSEGPLTYNWRILNGGTGATTNIRWWERVYLADTSVLSAATVIYNLGNVENFSALGAGQNYQVPDRTYTIPQGVQGRFFVIITTDTYNSQPESDESNNTRASSAINIALAPPPDLQVTALTANPLTAFSEDSITVNWTVRNLGTGPTTGSIWTDRIYLSQNPIFNPTGATIMGNRLRNGALVVNGSYNATQRIKLPANIQGAYYVHVVTDVNGNIFEFNREDNNSATSLPLNIILRPAPDLVVNNITVPYDTIYAGQGITAQWTDRNIGALPTGSFWNDDIYMSADTIFSSGTDRLLLRKPQTGPLLSLSSLSSQGQMAVPTNLPQGKYYFFALADATNNVNEFPNDNNNLSRPSDSVFLALPDLTVPLVQAPANAQSGQSITINYTVRNIGLGNILSNLSWVDGVYLSTDVLLDGSDISLGSITNNFALLSNNSYLGEQTVALPQFISGNYYLLTVTDASSTINEINNSNNVNAVPISITLAPWPDLVVNTVTAPANDTVGTTFTFSYRVTNNGSGNIANAQWQDAVYLSPTNNLNGAGNILLATIAQNRTLNAGGFYTEQRSVTLPANIAAGQYYIVVATDNNNALFENSADNNNRGISSPVQLAPLPNIDLAITSGTTSPDSVGSGQAIQVIYTVKNVGSVRTLPAGWRDVVYLSANATYEAGDRLIGSWPVTTSLQPGDSIRNVRTLVIPNDVGGSFYLLAITDKDNQQNDINQSNNIKVLNTGTGSGSGGGVIVITLPPPVDLLPVGINAPVEGFAGQPVWVKFTIRNSGPGKSFAPNWRDDVFLSTNPAALTGSSLTSKTHTDSLAAGADYTDSVQVFLENALNGNYALIVRTDATDKQFELNGENNNSASTAIFVRPQLPCDLIADTVFLPSSPQIAGQNVTLRWKLSNNGQNPANGFTREAVYLSTDTVFDAATDILMGTVDGNINIIPQQSANRQLTAPLNNVALGQYYIIIRTDILNNITETDEGNNTAVSILPFTIDVKQLFLGITANDTLFNNRSLYYRIHIADSLAGETMSLKLLGDTVKRAVNRLFLRLGETPAANVYDYLSAIPFAANQAITVPSVAAGNYYMLALGNDTSVQQRQLVTLLARIVPFEITSVDANKGGNTGSVTVRVNGAKFNPNTTFFLRSSAYGTIVASQVYFVNQSQVFVTYNLANAGLGKYHVVAKQLNGDSTRLLNGFEVVKGNGSLLAGNGGNGGSGFVCKITNVGFENNFETDIITPSGARLGQIVSVTIYFENTGNVDIPAPTRFLVALTDSVWVSFSAAGLAQKSKDLVLECKEPNGPPDILRPGASGSFKVYSVLRDRLFPLVRTLDYAIIE